MSETLYRRKFALNSTQAISTTLTQTPHSLIDLVVDEQNCNHKMGPLGCVAFTARNV